MSIRRRFAEWLFEKVQRRVVSKRHADFLVGGAQNPYMKRWWLIPRNRFFNIYLHEFLRSDDPRALHDHPWFSISLLLQGSLNEITNADGVTGLRFIQQGEWRFRSAKFAHRLELPYPDKPAWTLFFTGPVWREWGFHCLGRWVHWRDFTNADDPGETGPGCGDE